MKEQLFAFVSKLRSRANEGGFTMIELLIVIAILGILAVAVLSAINPVEQINRGRDTGNRSDAEQLISALDRYGAFQGYQPWLSSKADPAVVVPFTPVEDTNWVDNGTNGDCEVLNKLSEGDATAVDTCIGSDELKTAYVQKVSDTTYNSLYIYNQGNTGDSTYVCFVPVSQAFITEATERCTAGLPSDIPAGVAGGLCGDGTLNDVNGAAITTPMICLP